MIDAINVISFIFAIGSIIYAVYCNRKWSQLLEMERQHFSWEEIHTGCRKLAKAIKDFKPDCVVTTPGAPMLVTSLVIESLYQWLPIYIVMVSSADVENSPDVYDSNSYLTLKSSRHKWHIPHSLLQQTNLRILIIDDVIFNTVYFEKITEELENKGFNRNQLLTATLIAGANLQNSEALNLSSYYVTNTKLYLPWGEERK